MTTRSNRLPITLTTIAVLLGIVFAFPRLLSTWLGNDNPWTSYLYMYGFGLVFFSLGILLILKTGACKPGRGRDRFWLGVLLGGFVFFATLHAVWILAALYLPQQGGM